jgi:hypothetical protein
VQIRDLSYPHLRSQGKLNGIDADAVLCRLCFCNFRDQRGKRGTLSGHRS